MSHSEKLAYSSRPWSVWTLPSAPGYCAVHVGDDVGEQERVVERGVEGVLFGGRAAPDGDAAEEGVPLLRALPLATCWTDHPGSSACRFWAASAVLTNEMPTFMSTVRCDVGVERHVGAARRPGAELWSRGARPGLVQVPAEEKGRSNSATKCSV